MPTLFFYFTVNVSKGDWPMPDQQNKSTLIQYEVEYADKKKRVEAGLEPMMPCRTNSELSL